MCGRFSLGKPKLAKVKALRLKEEELSRLKPRYNIAPSQPVATIIGTPEPHIEPMKWGLVPSWAKDIAIGHKMINARSETLQEKPSFRGLLAHHRCLILADGFYEWHNEGKVKTPYYIRLKTGEPFTFAGLWSEWNGSDGSALRTCTIITCGPNALMERIHHRMPVILDGVPAAAWIDPALTDKAKLQALLKPFPAAKMELYAVSRLVNSPQNDTEEVLKPDPSMNNA